FLLHGVTGSGKTELYLQLIDAALQAGRTALVLVPEIALTPQLSARFMARFGRDVAVLHSALTPGQRADAWRRILLGEVRIALGPRSALFAPLSRLGVVIVDEEHDSSFKQQDGVRYHGRDTALVRAQQAGAVAVLGSATPSLESMELVRRGKLQRLTLLTRATGVPMPSVTVIDLKQHVFAEDRLLLSTPLQNAIKETLAAGEQAILFLNRRGYATFLLCQRCGHRLECPHCSVTLTWHKETGELCCHYCGQHEPVPEACPLCQQKSIQRLGLGTEKLQEQLAACFPTARVARLDRDTASHSGLHRVLAAMHRREIDLLIGTQMLAKGHDFPGVTLVGVVLADTGMGLPDFRASEKTFQLLAQVAGRAGRQGRPGRVLIQTYNPDHPAVTAAASHDYLTFAQGELYAREQLGYPPHCRLGLLRVDGVDPYAVRDAAHEVAATVRALIERLGREGEADAALSLLGPAEAPLSRLKGRTRWQMIVRAPQSRALRALLRAALQITLPRALRLTAHVDPVSTL
ncbi:MAG TPA: primosomal protein N', partial [Pseudomonadota bacterium]|nr:primosomal protein N' [Pseudomonadota bacterium]